MTRETLVEALTERGAGYWVLTPLRTGDGMILVNRGFVPAERADPATRRPGQVKGASRVDGPASVQLSREGASCAPTGPPRALVQSRRRGHRQGARAWRRRALLHRCGRRAQPGGTAGRRADGRPFPQRALGLCADLVRAGRPVAVRAGPDDPDYSRTAISHAARSRFSKLIRALQAQLGD